MAYQVPRSDHPWRRYKNRLQKEDQNKKKSEVSVSVKQFISELAESWDTVEVITTSYEEEGRFKLSELSQSKQAAWLANILKKNYS